MCSFPDPPEQEPKFRHILERNPDPKYTLTDHLWNYLQEYAKKHKTKGNGFGYGMTDLNGVARTLSARYYKDGSEVLIQQGKENNPRRRLTPVESKRLMRISDDLGVPLRYATGRAIRSKSSLRSGLSTSIPNAKDLSVKSLAA